jgi:hypothetical protein
MIKNASSLSVSEVLMGLFDINEDDPILNGTISINSAMYGVRHFSYNGIKEELSGLAPVHRYTILINYSKVYESNIVEIRRYDVDVQEVLGELKMKAKVIRPPKQVVKQVASA